MTDPSPRLRRSVLYMPASNRRMIDKARALDCDGLILDLEDAVAVGDKLNARAAMVEALTGGGFGHREVIVRVNGRNTPWGEADIDAAGAARPDGIALPKVESPADIAAASARLDRLDAARRIRLWALIETPAALFDLPAIAGAGHGRLAGLIVGVNDLMQATGGRPVPGRWPLVPWLMAIVAAGHAHRLAVLDGVFNSLDDAEGLAAECRQGRDMGFTGKTLVHPRQIATANAAFAPTPDELARARRIVAFFAAPENAGLGVGRVDGGMVERLHAEAAARLIAVAATLTARLDSTARPAD